MTYNVFSGTLNPTQSINLRFAHHCLWKVLIIIMLVYCVKIGDNSQLCCVRTAKHIIKVSDRLITTSFMFLTPNICDIQRKWTSSRHKVKAAAVVCIIHTTWKNSKMWKSRNVRLELPSLQMQLDSMRWFSHQRSRRQRALPSPPHPSVTTQWYHLLLLSAYGLWRTPYYALSMGMTQQFFFFFCPWWPWPLTLIFELWRVFAHCT